MHGIDFDNDQAECGRCGALFTPDDEACACCLRCGGRGSLVSGLGAGKGTEQVTCSACEGTGLAEHDPPAPDTTDAGEPMVWSTVLGEWRAA
jgi:hypothetical protein